MDRRGIGVRQFARLIANHPSTTSGFDAWKRNVNRWLAGKTISPEKAQELGVALERPGAFDGFVPQASDDRQPNSTEIVLERMRRDRLAWQREFRRLRDELEAEREARVQSDERVTELELALEEMRRAS